MVTGPDGLGALWGLSAPRPRPPHLFSHPREDPAISSPSARTLRPSAISTAPHRRRPPSRASSSRRLVRPRQPTAVLASHRRCGRGFRASRAARSSLRFLSIPGTLGRCGGQGLVAAKARGARHVCGGGEGASAARVRRRIMATGTSVGAGSRDERRLDACRRRGRPRSPPRATHHVREIEQERGRAPSRRSAVEPAPQGRPPGPERPPPPPGRSVPFRRPSRTIASAIVGPLRQAHGLVRVAALSAPRDAPLLRIFTARRGRALAQPEPFDPARCPSGDPEPYGGRSSRARDLDAEVRAASSCKRPVRESLQESLSRPPARRGAVPACPRSSRGCSSRLPRAAARGFFQIAFDSRSCRGMHFFWNTSWRAIGSATSRGDRASIARFHACARRSRPGRRVLSHRDFHSRNRCRTGLLTGSTSRTRAWTAVYALASLLRTRTST